MRLLILILGILFSINCLGQRTLVVDKVRMNGKTMDRIVDDSTLTDVTNNDFVTAKAVKDYVDNIANLGGGGNNGGEFAVLANFNELRNYDGSLNIILIEDDEKSGMFFLSDSMQTDDNGYIINDGLGRSWVRKNSGILPEFYGAIGNDEISDNAAILAAAAAAKKNNLPLVFLKKRYVANNLLLPDSIYMEGNGATIYNPVTSGVAGANNTFNFVGSASLQDTTSLIETFGIRQYDIRVSNSSIFEPGDRVLIEEQIGGDTAKYQFQEIEFVVGDTLRMYYFIDELFDVSKNVRVSKLEMKGDLQIKNFSFEAPINAQGGSGIYLDFCENVKIHNVKGAFNRTTTVAVHNSNSIELVEIEGFKNKLYTAEISHSSNVAIRGGKVKQNGQGGILTTNKSKYINYSNLFFEANGTANKLSGGDNLQFGAGANNVVLDNLYMANSNCYNIWILSSCEKFQINNSSIFNGITGGILADGNQISINNCLINGNSFGVAVNGNSVFVKNCEIKGNDSYGILIASNTAGHEITDNFIGSNLGNAGNLYVGTTITDTKIENNTIGAGVGITNLSVGTNLSICMNKNSSVSQNCNYFAGVWDTNANDVYLSSGKKVGVGIIPSNLVDVYNDVEDSYLAIRSSTTAPNILGLKFSHGASDKLLFQFFPTSSTVNLFGTNMANVGLLRTVQKLVIGSLTDKVVIGASNQNVAEFSIESGIKTLQLPLGILNIGRVVTNSTYTADGSSVGNNTFFQGNDGNVYFKNLNGVVKQLSN